MEFKDIAAVPGKGGLFTLLKSTKTGAILESLDDHKTRFVAGAQKKISVLEEISIYTSDREGTAPLKEVMKKIYTEFGDDLGVDKSSDAEELKRFMAHVLPEYDKEQVYVSDIKKIVTWYRILLQRAPELLNPVEKSSEEAKV